MVTNKLYNYIRHAAENRHDEEVEMAGTLEQEAPKVSCQMHSVINASRKMGEEGGSGLNYILSN